MLSLLFHTLHNPMRCAASSEDCGTHKHWRFLLQCERSSDGTGKRERESRREGGREASCCRTTFSPGRGVKRRTAAHLLHPSINPVVAMVSSLLCSIMTLPCSFLCCTRSAGMFIGLTLRKMITATLFIVCSLHVKWLFQWICFNRARSDPPQQCCCAFFTADDTNNADL